MAARESDDKISWPRRYGSLAGNVADMSRHVADDTLCRSNFGQMGPCRRHNFFDVVAVCVG
jgi:hypothetical protein